MIENTKQTSLYGMLGILPKRIALAAEAAGRLEQAEEIRLRVGKPPQLVFSDSDQLLEASPFTAAEAKELLDKLCRRSVYAHEEELKRGFIAVEGGARVGVSGRPVVVNGRIERLTDIFCFNIRLTREALGCAEDLMSYLTENGRPVSSLIAAPPSGGKTTLLRDTARCFSCGIGALPVKVAIADERGELAGCTAEGPGFTLGPRTDVMELAPKAEAIKIFVRSMSPDLIITDEIGGADDAEALAEATRCGVAVIASVHASSADELKKRKSLAPIFESEVFKRVLLLKRRGSLLRINPVRL